MATTVTVGSSTFTISGDGYTTGNFADGPGWVVIPSGSDSLTGVSPAQTTDSGGYAINGAMLNPQNTKVSPDGNDQGWDGRMAKVGNARYLSGLSISYPQTITAGDVIAKSVAKDTSEIVWVVGSGSYADGIMNEMNVLFVLSSAPGADDFSPACFGWTGRGNPAPITLSTDLDTLVASLPSYDLTGMNYPPVVNVIDYIDHFDPIYGWNVGTDRENGSSYESMSVYKYGTYGGYSNYGRERGEAIGSAGLHLLGNVASTAQKKTILKRMISAGIQWGYPWFGANQPFGGNGAHHQFHGFPVALAVTYAGLGAGLSDIITYMPGNIFGQPFRITQSWLDTNYVYHVDSAKPEAFHRHTIQSVSGNNITVNQPRGTFELNGTLMRRESDLAGATITNSNGATGQVTHDSTLVIDAQPTPAFQVGDVVHFAFPVEPTAGDVNWDIRTTNSIGNVDYFNPSWKANYRTLQCYSDDVMLMKALSVWHADFDYVKDYVELCEEANTPTATNDYPPHEESFDGYTFIADFKASYWDTIVNASESPGNIPANGQITVSVTIS